MRSRIASLFCALAILACGVQIASAAETRRVYVKQVKDEATWNKYSKVLNTDRYGKFIIDIKSDRIYFIDVNVFKLHADFVLGVLLKQAWTRENIIEYNKNYERKKPRFILGYLTQHLKVKKFTFAFWEGDKIDAPTVMRVYKKLNKTFFRKKLLFRPDSPMQMKVAKQVRRRGIKTITNDQIYKGARYQAFNKGKTVGRLRVVKPGTPYESLTFDQHDIVLLQEIYPDISPVAGIIASKFSTPLSHVNLRAKAWRIPNAGFVDALKNYGKLDGKVVYYEVKAATHVMRPATAAEIEAHKKEVQKARTVVTPKADLSNANLAMLTHIRASDVVAYGAKTSNLGEIASAGLTGVNVPAGFGIPFYYYDRHMKQNGLDKKVDALLSDPRFKTDAKWRRAQSKKLRDAIMVAPMDTKVLDAIYKRVRIKLGGKGVFVRSSTNAEDLEGFNGAGLYDTVPNVRGKKNIGKAIKKVWSSLWNWRAVEERTHFGIDHRGVYAGVMVQIGVNASAAGVLITRNLFNPAETDTFTINAKWGLGIRVVQGTKVPEQILFDTSNDGTKIISRSDDSTMLVFDENGGIKEVPTKSKEVILSEARAKRLSQAVMRFRPLFPTDYPLDVEWLFEGEKVWIVQSRPFVQ
jgi:hypothetical protein